VTALGFGVSYTQIFLAHVPALGQGLSWRGLRTAGRDQKHGEMADVNQFLRWYILRMNMSSVRALYVTIACTLS